MTIYAMYDLMFVIKPVIWYKLKLKQIFDLLRYFHTKSIWMYSEWFSALFITYFVINYKFKVMSVIK